MCSATEKGAWIGVLDRNVPDSSRLVCTGSRPEAAQLLDMLRGAPQEAERLELEAELISMVQVGSQLVVYGAVNAKG